MFHMSREIYDKINELALLIKQSEAYAARQQAEDAARKDAGLAACMEEYEKLRRQIEAETSGDSRDFDKISGLTRELDEISSQMEGFASYRDLKDKRERLDQLLDGVCDALQGIVNPDIQCECSGNCAACGGCGAAQN